MGYVEFQKPEKYEAVLPANWGEMFAQSYLQGRHQRDMREEREQQFQNNFKIGSQEGYFPQIQSKINSKVQEAVSRQQAYHMRGGKGIDPNVRALQSEISNDSNMGKALWQQKTDKEQQIARLKAEDPYYDARPDEEHLYKSFDPNFTNPEDIADHLNNWNPGANVKDTFHEDKALADFVKTAGEHESDNDTTDRSGIKKSYMYKGKFFGPKGTPEITEETVNNLFSFEPRAKQLAFEKTHDQIINEVKAAKAANETWQDTRNLPTSDLINNGEPFRVRDRPEAELFSDIFHHPGINPNGPKSKGFDENGNPVFTPKTFGQRTFDYAKKKLAQFEDTTSKAEVNAGNYEPDKARGITSKIYTVVPQFDSNSYGGAGGVLVNKQKGTNGISIPVRGQVFDKTEKKLKSGRGDLEMFATNYNYLPVSKDGTPVDWTHLSVDDQVKAIKEMPESQVKDFELKTVVHGQAYNKLDLNKSRGQAEALRLKKNRTEEENKKLTDLESSLEAIGIDPDLAPEVLAKGLGIPVDDVIKVADNATAAQIEGKLGQFNILSKHNETDDQRRIRQAWEQKKGQIDQTTAELGSGNKATVTKAKTRLKEENLATITKNQPLKEKYEMKGVSYSVDELKNLGYTEEEIKAAHLQKIIK